MKVAKFIVALIGAIGSAVATVVAGDSTAGKVVAIVLVIVSAIGVYLTPNAPATPPAPPAGR